MLAKLRRPAVKLSKKLKYFKIPFMSPVESHSIQLQTDSWRVGEITLEDVPGNIWDSFDRLDNCLKSSW